MHYDPAHEPLREHWTALDEAERIALVTEYHRRASIKLPNLRAHAALHVVIENQALMGDETHVAATLVRLMHEGLDRHDAVHAVASVLSGVLFDQIKGRGADGINAAYFRELAQLTAGKWLSQSDDGPHA